MMNSAPVGGGMTCLGRAFCPRQGQTPCPTVQSFGRGCGAQLSTHMRCVMPALLRSLLSDGQSWFQPQSRPQHVASRFDKTAVDDARDRHHDQCGINLHGVRAVAKFWTLEYKRRGGGDQVEKTRRWYGRDQVQDSGGRLVEVRFWTPARV